MTAPTVSVVVPIYNASRTIAASITSLLSQTLLDAEFLLINDGSTDETQDIIAEYRDSRIRLLTQSNQGLAATLNRGLREARGRYIARLDADDVSLPGRLAKQVAFLDRHPQVSLLGTWAEIRDGDRSTGRFHRHACSSSAIQLELLLDNPFVHSSVMMRADVVRQLGGYRVERSTRFPEDYDLWSRIAPEHDLGNLPEVLTVYREVPGSLSRGGANEILANVVKISGGNIERVLGGHATARDCQALSALYHGTETKGLALHRALLMWREAAKAVAGPPNDWTDECRSIYRRVRRQLLTRFARRHLPPQVVGVLHSMVTSRRT